MISDLLIGLSYVSISLTLYVLIRKIRLPFSAVVLSFGVFIGACGATHFMEVWNLWYSHYWLAGFIKCLTAIASVATGVWLFRLRPQIISVVAASRLSEERGVRLEHSAKMAALGEMAGGIAHEINSPLGIITVHANQLERLLKRGTLTPEQITQEAQLISATAKRIGEIIKGLRAFAREGENDPFVFTSVAVVVRDTLVLCQNRFRTNGVELRIAAFPEDLEVQCRPVQIGQVLLNLLSNSFDAVQPLAEKWVSLEVEDRGDEVLFAVTDSGRGLARQVYPKVFQPFFTTKDVGKGTGLGLSISKGIVDAHHGLIALDQDSAHTRFYFRLPKIHLPSSNPGNAP